MPRTSLEPWLRRLYVEQWLSWAVAWLIGIGCLFTLAVFTHGRLSEQDLDAELGLFATAVYGLGWFDETGRFRDDLLLREPDLLDGPFDLWVIEPGANALTHLAPGTPRFQISTLPTIAASIVDSEAEEYYEDGRDMLDLPYRLHGTTTYDEAGAARAAIFVVADPKPWQAIHRRFIAETGLAVLVLAAAGLLVGAVLSRRSLNPVLTSLMEQERFLAAAAHELRTPVTSLRAVCESAQNGEETAEAALARVARLALRTGNLVDQLLLLARLDASKAMAHQQPVRLDLMAEAVFPEDGSVLFEAEESIVEAEPALLETALRNLVENARVHGASPDDEATVRVIVRGGEVKVEDDGPGFPGQLLAQAAEPFVARPGSPGTGLGLAIVRLIAERHQARLILENRRSGGARAVLRFARATSSTSRAEKSS